MPVQLTNCSLGQVLLSPGNVMALREVSDDLLPDPTAFEYSRFGIRKAPFQIRHDATICRLATEVVWILKVELVVCSSCSACQLPLHFDRALILTK